MKLNCEYFKPGVSHVCMFCSTPLALLRDGKFHPLGNKVHVLLRKKSPGAYIINCCIECSKRVDFSQKSVLDAIHLNVVKCMKSLSNLDPQIESPIIGKYVIEKDTSKRRESLKTLLPEKA